MSEQKIACLLCARCKFPLVTKSDIIAARADVWSDQVYSYELDVLGDDIWVYSATNPSANRFDVVRCGASTNPDTVIFEQEFSGEHTWFPGYDWSMASCGTCGVHLGWAFSRASAPSVQPEKREAQTSDNRQDGADSSCSDDEPPALERTVQFFGLIVTKCVAKEDYSLAKFEREIEGAPQRRREFEQNSSTSHKLFRLLDSLKNRVAANRLAMQVAQLEMSGQLTTSALQSLVALAAEAVEKELEDRRRDRARGVRTARQREEPLVEDDRERTD